jgi:ATP-dependent helicase/nuclease subunit A
MQDFVEAYRERKQRAGKLDFLDLLLLVRNLVRDDAGVRKYLQERFSRIFVDEFQDTDPLQAEILILLSAGDPAESDWLQVTPGSRQAFRGGRSQAIHLQIPARRCGVI